jgi:hypothetical protein
MSRAIDFLERLGQDAGLRHAAPEDLQSLLAEAGLQPDVQRTVLASDVDRLYALLGGAASICVQFPADEEEEGEGEEEEEQAPLDQGMHVGAHVLGLDRATS